MLLLPASFSYKIPRLTLHDIFETYRKILLSLFSSISRQEHDP